MSEHGPAADAVRALDGRVPRVAIILGSGLGGLIDDVRERIDVPYADLPGFPEPTVSGHAAHLSTGTLDGVPIIAFAGRLHLYEGHDPAVAARPIRLAHALGARVLFVSNAAGGIRRTFRAGDLMLIRDHINLMSRNPLTGPVAPGEPRFPDMSAPYDAALLVLLRDAARDARVPVVEGVYAAFLGPSYETAAEVRMLERIGADAIGMSTVPEVIVARALGMRVAGVSCIANPASGLSAAPLAHDDVLAAIGRASRDFQRLVRAFVARLA